MSTSEVKAPFAWQPLTGNGLAAFAGAPLSRLLLLQLIVALLVATSVVWFLNKAWFPTIGEAIRQLPLQGEVCSGRLSWGGGSPVRLAEGRFLAVGVDLDHSGSLRSPAHVQVEFGRADLSVYSLFGSVRRADPKSWALALNQKSLRPWWGAWAPAILGVVAVLVTAGLMISWSCLATVYCPLVWLAGFYADRDLSLGGSWRLAGAALMPGALLICLAIWMYGWGALDPVQLAVAGAAHLAMGWVYLVVGLVYSPLQPAEARAQKNPFA